MFGDLEDSDDEEFYVDEVTKNKRNPYSHLNKRKASSKFQHAADSSTGSFTKELQNGQSQKKRGRPPKLRECDLQNSINCVQSNRQRGRPKKKTSSPPFPPLSHHDSKSELYSLDDEILTLEKRLKFLKERKIELTAVVESFDNISSDSSSSALM